MSHGFSLIAVKRPQDRAEPTSHAWQDEWQQKRPSNQQLPQPINDCRFAGTFNILVGALVIRRDSNISGARDRGNQRSNRRRGHGINDCRFRREVNVYLQDASCGAKGSSHSPRARRAGHVTDRQPRYRRARHITGAEDSVGDQRSV
jgi:hypothetical protein